ncbi:hypothetical protein ACFSO7_16830 [Bacillus sp. CGMCC 1.16607]
MAKKKILDLVNRLKQSGIKVSLTKPKSNYHLPLLTNQHCSAK